MYFTKFSQLLAILVMLLTVVSCNDEEGPPQMLWVVSAQPQENVSVMSFPDYHPQISIIANKNQGEVTLTCVNYTYLSLAYNDNINVTQIIKDREMNFTAKVEEENKIVILFEQMPETFDTQIETWLKINANNGVHSNMCVARITRMP